MDMIGGIIGLAWVPLFLCFPSFQCLDLGGLNGLSKRFCLLFQFTFVQFQLPQLAVQFREFLLGHESFADAVGNAAFV